MPSNLYKETLSRFLQVDVKSRTGNKGFAKATADVLARRDLNPACKVVFYGMALESEGTGHIAISDQALALVCGLSRPCVVKSRPMLVSAGLISPDGPKVKQVQPYRILHPAVISTKDGGELKSVPVKRASITCPRCKNKRPALLRAGICRSCNWEIKVRRVAREEIRAEKQDRKPVLVA